MTGDQLAASREEETSQTHRDSSTLLGRSRLTIAELNDAALGSTLLRKRCATSLSADSPLTRVVTAGLIEAQVQGMEALIQAMEAFGRSVFRRRCALASSTTIRRL